jgi:hypothetical protein
MRDRKERVLRRRKGRREEREGGGSYLNAIHCQSGYATGKGRTARLLIA